MFVTVYSNIYAPSHTCLSLPVTLLRRSLTGFSVIGTRKDSRWVIRHCLQSVSLSLDWVESPSCFFQAVKHPTERGITEKPCLPPSTSSDQKSCQEACPDCMVMSHQLPHPPDPGLEAEEFALATPVIAPSRAQAMRSLSRFTPLMLPAWLVLSDASDASISITQQC